jgi:hypothetical protein
MYPQEFILLFPKETTLKKIILSCRRGILRVTKFLNYKYSQRLMIIMNCLPNKVQLSDIGLEDIDSIQTCAMEPATSTTTTKLKFVIVKGHEAFSSVHRLVIYG